MKELAMKELAMEGGNGGRQWREAMKGGNEGAGNDIRPVL